MRKHFRFGQSILEYTLILGVVIAIAVTIIFTAMKPAITKAYDKTGKALDKTAEELTHGIFQQ